MTRFLIIVTLSLAALACTTAVSLDATHQAPAQCDTDTDCLRLCPAADADCDGGPQA
jgi:hypothetical protein